MTYASVDRRCNEATVHRTVGKASNSQLVQAVRRVGYTASIIPVKSSTLSVNMGCKGCPAKVRSALSRVRGVRTVSLQGTTAAKVEYDSRRASESNLILAVKRAGFTATAVNARRVATRRVVRTTARPVSRPATTTRR